MAFFTITSLNLHQEVILTVFLFSQTRSDSACLVFGHDALDKHIQTLWIHDLCDFMSYLGFGLYSGCIYDIINIMKKVLTYKRKYCCYLAFVKSNSYDVSSFFEEVSNWQFFGLNPPPFA